MLFSLQQILISSVLNERVLEAIVPHRVAGPRPEAVIATALWTMTAWAHEGATHSPILAAISVEPDSGKSTLLGVLRFLVPKPFVSVEPTGPSVYRTVDREHPTLIIDEADDLFYRKSDLRGLIVGSRKHQTDFVRALDATGVKPIVDRIFGLDEIADAFRYEAGGHHFGKICLEY